VQRGKGEGWRGWLCECRLSAASLSSAMASVSVYFLISDKIVAAIFAFFGANVFCDQFV
jgi:hypothetical protein